MLFYETTGVIIWNRLVPGVATDINMHVNRQQELCHNQLSCNQPLKASKNVPTQNRKKGKATKSEKMVAWIPSHC